MCDSTVYIDTIQDNRHYMDILTDAIYDNIPGFAVLCSFDKEIELLNANKQFYQYFSIDMQESHIVFSRGQNQLIDTFYEHEAEIRSPKNNTFTCSIKQIEGRRDWYLVKVIRPKEKDSSIFLFICIDISDQKRLQEQLEEEKKRYQVALECSEDTIFEYNRTTDLFITYGVFSNKDIPKDTLVQLPNFSERLKNGKLVHKDDIEKIRYIIEGTDDVNIEARIVYGNKNENEYKWAKVEAKRLVINGEAKKIIGKLTNIHEHKIEELKSMETLYVDKLTGIYNKERMDYLIEQHTMFFRDEKYAVAVLDICNFSAVNDNFGYHFGDILLKDITTVLMSRKNENDILARIGGDEFMLLIKKADKVNLNKYIKNMIQKILPNYFGSVYEDITIDVGIAEAMPGEDWNTVVEHSKQALMYAKSDKKKIVFFSAIAENGLSLEKELEFKPSGLYKNETEISDNISGMVSFALDLLERSKDAKQAMNLLLVRMSKVFGLSAVSIYETDFNYLVSSSLYRVKGGTLLENRQIRHKSRSDIEEIYSSAGDDGFIHLNSANMNTAEKELSNLLFSEEENDILLSVIYNEGRPRGYIVFCSENQGKFDLEMRLRLKEVAKIIATHINKASSDAASRMKSDFLSRMSHEIRTPMNAIICMTEIALSCLNDTDRILDSLSKIDTSTKYLLSLVNDILDMSKIESGKMKLNIERFNLSKLIDSIDLLVRPQAEKKSINFTIIRDYTEEIVFGDEIKITQVLVNLASNALKFTGEKGKIILRIEQLLNEDDSVVYRFLLKDSGIGIDNKNLKRIFMAFEQAEDDTSEKFGGTGLGLAISNSLVQLMESHIEVKSRLGKGSEFYFTLSLKKAADYIGEIQNNKDKGEHDINYDFTGKRILIAEDNQLNAEIADTILSMAGFETEIAENGAVAFKIFSDKPTGYYDVILMDIRMPVMDGLEATRRIRALDRPDAMSVPIIAMTANAFDEDMKKSINNGMNAHLSKPIDTRKLYSTLKENLK